ncbi:hypothetical protein MD484_g2143, partial [Candolleomyces efflorescens]
MRNLLLDNSKITRFRYEKAGAPLDLCVEAMRSLPKLEHCTLHCLVLSPSSSTILPIYLPDLRNLDIRIDFGPGTHRDQAGAFWGALQIPNLSSLRVDALYHSPVQISRLFQRSQNLKKLTIIWKTAEAEELLDTIQHATAITSLSLGLDGDEFLPVISSLAPTDETPSRILFPDLKVIRIYPVEIEDFLDFRHDGTVRLSSKFLVAFIQMAQARMIVARNSRMAPLDTALLHHPAHSEAAVEVIENTVFKVPRYSFSLFESESLSEALRGQAVVTLREVTASEFRALLKLLFPNPLTRSPDPRMDLTKDEWVAVLKVSTLWHSRDLRKMAIHHIELQAKNPVERVLFGKAHYVSSWLLNGYATLITRSEPISEQESIAIGLLTAIRLYLIRHELQSWDTTKSFHDALHEGICSAFSEEISMLERRESEYATQDDLEKQKEEAEEKAAAESRRKQQEEERRRRETKVEKRCSDEIKRSVPRQHFIAGSEFFANKYGLLDPVANSPQAATPTRYHLTFEPGRHTPSQPVHLDGVKKGEFEIFLKLVFPVFTTSTTLGFSPSEWITILKLSSLWSFIGYRKLAIDQLEEHLTTPIDLVDCAREFGVSNWLVSGFKGLVERPELLDEMIGARLGYPVAFKLSVLREERLKGTSQGVKFYSNKFPQASTSSIEIEEKIYARFHDELEEIKEQEKKYRTTQEIEEDEKLREVEEKTRKEEEVVQQAQTRIHIEEAQAKLQKDEEDLKARQEKLHLKRAELEKKKLQLEDGNSTPAPVRLPTPGSKKARGER